MLVNQAHSDPDLILPINANEMQIVSAIDGKRTIDEIIHKVSPPDAKNLNQMKIQARRFFEKLYWYDQVVFDTSSKGSDASNDYNFSTKD